MEILDNITNYNNLPRAKKSSDIPAFSKYLIKNHNISVTFRKMRREAAMISIARGGKFRGIIERQILSERWIAASFPARE